MNHVRLRSKLTYDPKTGLWTRYGRPYGHIRNGYRYLHFDNKRWAASRLAWFYMTGKMPEAFIAHKNKNKLDDRWENLEHTTKSKIARWRTRPKNNDLPRWVYHNKNKQRYYASVKASKKSQYLGTFDTPDAAHKAALEFLREIGE